MDSLQLTWIIAGLTALGVIVRPFGWPEAVYAVAGALLLLLVGGVSLEGAATGVARGFDVYLFLIGMMLLSELARREGLFDWLAVIATRRAGGSPRRLFVLIYIVGTLVTVFLSNDATAVVLTPAVYAATKAARVKDPMPYLLVCAFIANAASFVLPISNPANLVIFSGGDMPPLSRWLATFGLPSLVAIVSTFLLLYLTQRKAIAEDRLSADIDAVHLTGSARLAGLGLVAAAVVLVAASALGADLGLPTLVAGLLTTALVLIAKRENPVPVFSGISWSVLPLVAGLFVVVEALDATGLTQLLAERLSAHTAEAPAETAMVAGLAIGFLSNLVNNLPAGLLAGSAVQAAHVGDLVSGGILIGVDLGPNLSVTGSLATILWLTALRREGQSMGGLAFLKIGCLVMIPALVATLLCLIAIG